MAQGAREGEPRRAPPHAWIDHVLLLFTAAFIGAATWFFWWIHEDSERQGDLEKLLKYFGFYKSALLFAAPALAAWVAVVLAIRRLVRPASFSDRTRLAWACSLVGAIAGWPLTFAAVVVISIVQIYLTALRNADWRPIP